MSIQITLVYNRANPFGIKQDAELFESAIRQYNSSVGVQFAKVKHADLLEPPQATDICIHLEIPSTTWMPFAHTNILMMNPEWWVAEWNCLLPRFDEVLYKINTVDVSGTYVPWCTLVERSKKHPQAMNLSAGCLWLLGGSRNKRLMAEKILPLWKESYPSLTVYTTSALDVSGSSNVTVKVQDLEDEQRKQLQAYYPVHLALSRSEGFGLAAVEAEAAGAYCVVNTIPAYQCAFGGQANVGWVKTPVLSDSKYPYAKFVDLSGSIEGLDEAMAALSSVSFETVREEQHAISRARVDTFYSSMNSIFKRVAEGVKQKKSLLRGNRHLPPYLDNTDCPPISIITPTYNRRKFIDLAFHNILLSEYPKDKIEWIIVDDSDDPAESVSDKVAQFAKRAPVAQVVYVPLPKKHSIGYKRNVGIERASHDVIVFMDDDDHYPETSFRRRVAWLTKHPWKPQAVACSTIACYDLVKGVSAVNTPPWDLGPAKRISEATLTFYKSFWEQKKFPHTSMAEGEEFLSGRESALLDIPPQQILVAFSHQGNSSGRRIPTTDEVKPGCFWGFPKEYTIWIHKLAGIEVEEEKETHETRKRKS
jgi:hypothetical protein